ncbi:VOC family protein [Arthrobacter sp. AOP36-A1-22]|uniref:VOC family protein n=1 Tax=Arthrobacter sp. AOP36-A1-22 TaxID=3457684 RepID=UPI0026519441|nr:VOC family protein [Micrococcaceae bacterium]
MSAHELDHLAIAVPAWAPAGPVLNRELGARWGGGFTTEAFNPCQLAVVDDMRVELLEPSGSEHSFIQRFLDQHEGSAAPHHVTFKVGDIRSAIAAAQEAGIEPILVNLQHPGWQEAFLHPRDTGLGFLAQLVQSTTILDASAEQLPHSTGGCPWDEQNTDPVRVQLIHGVVEDLPLARTVLVDVLGARTFGIGPAPRGQSDVLGFGWNEGADLVLSQGTAIGVDAIGILPAETFWPPGDYPTDLTAQLGEGTGHPELGIRIAALRSATVSADS